MNTKRFLYRLARAVLSHNERQRVIKFDDVLVVGAEAPDAFDQHLWTTRKGQVPEGDTTSCAWKITYAKLAFSTVDMLLSGCRGRPHVKGLWYVPAGMPAINYCHASPHQRTSSHTHLGFKRLRSVENYVDNGAIWADAPPKAPNARAQHGP
jgi:hypothetical protein